MTPNRKFFLLEPTPATEAAVRRQMPETMGQHENEEEKEEEEEEEEEEELISLNMIK